MSEAGLDRIGELLVKQVRDPSIDNIRNVLLGRMKGDDAERVRKALAGLEDEALVKFAAVVPELVDQVVHNLCVMLEEDDDLDLVLETNSGSVVASQESDGLAGELYGEDGWLARFGAGKT